MRRLVVPGRAAGPVRSGLDRVFLGCFGVGASGWGGPLVVAAGQLFDVPAGAVLDPVVVAAPHAAVTGAGAAFGPRDRVVPFAAAGVPDADGEHAFAVAGLGEPPPGVAGVGPGGLIAVVAVPVRDGGELDGQDEVAEGQGPGAVPAGWSGAGRGEGDGGPVTGAAGSVLPGSGRGARFGFPGPGGFAVADGVSVGVGDDDAEGAAGVLGGLGGEPAGQAGVQDAQAVCFAGPLGESEEAEHGDGHVEVGRQPVPAAGAGASVPGRAAPVPRPAVPAVLRAAVLVPVARSVVVLAVLVVLGCGVRAVAVPVG